MNNKWIFWEKIRIKWATVRGQTRSLEQQKSLLFSFLYLLKPLGGAACVWPLPWFAIRTAKWCFLGKCRAYEWPNNSNYKCFRRYGNGNKTEWKWTPQIVKCAEWTLKMIFVTTFSHKMRLRSENLLSVTTPPPFVVFLTISFPSKSHQIVHL